MYMIWQVIVWNGQQRPLAITALHVLTGEAYAATAAATRAFATAPTIRAVAMASSLSGHFYICRTEC